jgi:lipopolysaccharide biosynthesis glycosyltransferase
MTARDGIKPALRKAVRRGARQVPPLDRALVARRARLDRTERLELMYQRLNVQFGDRAGTKGRPKAGGLPSVEDIRRLETAVLGAGRSDAAEGEFFRTFGRDQDIERAALSLTRNLLKIDASAAARTVAQVFQLHPQLSRVGDICQAELELVFSVETAWSLLSRHDVDYVLRLSPAQYFRAGFRVDPQAAAAVLEAVRAGKHTISLGAAGWLDIAETSFVAGAEDLSAWALDQADTLRGNGARGTVLGTDIAWLRNWYGRAGRSADPVPAGEIPFAVMDYKQPDRLRSSTNLGDPVQTLASLGHLARRRGLRFTGDAELAPFVTELQSRVKPERVVEGDAATLRLYRVDRDASRYASVPDGTWMIAFGWFMHQTFWMGHDFPFNRNLRPFFISFHLNRPTLLTPDVVEYLREHAPIGCRDWNTVHLLQAAGIPAFFSGCLTTTIDTVFPETALARPEGTLFVDVKPTGPGQTFAQEFGAVRARPLVANLADALERVQSYRDTYEQVVTSRLHCYLPSRSIGANVEFRPKNPSNVRFDGLAGISDTAFDTMRAGVLEKLDAVLAAITRGANTDEVYAVWRDVCAADVALAEQRRADVPPLPADEFDVAAACRAIRARTVVVERSEPGPDGSEICVEFSLDGNLKHQLEVLLHSIVSRASRPIRAYVLCRDHTDADFARLAEHFPTVSFEWLPTDEVDHGSIAGMPRHIMAAATMDRLLLPDLLPEVGRIIHHDIDALCLTDLAQLYDIDMAGLPIAGRTAPHPLHRPGFFKFIRAAQGMRNDPARAREFILRTHARHGFDFERFQAGIMVLDLAQMRADGFCRDFLPYAKRFGLNDQAVLNAYAGANRVELDEAWNWNPRHEMMARPKIAHWAGPLKPWGPAWVQGKELWQAAEVEFAEISRAGRTPRTSRASAART